MADPLPARVVLVVPLTRSNDPLLTCAICNRDGVEYEFGSREPGVRRAHGLHMHCAQAIGEAK